MDVQALRVSLVLATATALSLLVVGIPIAYWLAFTRSRMRAIVEPVVALPLVLPPTVLGFYVLVALGPRSPVGRAIEIRCAEQERLLLGHFFRWPEQPLARQAQQRQQRQRGGQQQQRQVWAAAPRRRLVKQ